MARCSIEEVMASCFLWRLKPSQHPEPDRPSQPLGNQFPLLPPQQPGHSGCYRHLSCCRAPSSWTATWRRCGDATSHTSPSQTTRSCCSRCAGWSVAISSNLQDRGFNTSEWQHSSTPCLHSPCQTTRRCCSRGELWVATFIAAWQQAGKRAESHVFPMSHPPCCSRMAQAASPQAAAASQLPTTRGSELQRWSSRNRVPSLPPASALLCWWLLGPVYSDRCSGV